VKVRNAALARRKGILESTGEYLCFADSDDLIAPDYIQLLYDALIENNVEISAGHISILAKQDVEQRPQLATRIHVETDIMSYFFSNYHWDQHGGQVPQSINAKMFKKSTLNEIDYSVIKTNVLEDNFISVQILANLKTKRIALVDRTIYYYRINSTSTMGESLSRLISYAHKELSYVELFEIVTDYIKKTFSNYKDIDVYVGELKLKEYYNLASAATDMSMHNADLEKENRELTRQNRIISNECDKIRASLAYRIGGAIAYPVRIMKSRIKKLRSPRHP
jgi:glycosyltransferase involved in cell wall biosynthesis